MEEEHGPTTQPSTIMGRRIVTVLDYTGPLPLGDIARTLDELETDVLASLKVLQDLGYVRQEGFAAHWASTRVWRPDPKGTVTGAHTVQERPWKRGIDELNP